MKIYDKSGAERDWVWLQATFGAGVRVDARPDANLPGYEVVELRAKDGPCTLVARVLDEHGAPAAGVLVARWWDDPHLDPLPEGLATWHPLGVYGSTNDGGDIGFGMGGGDGYDPAWPADKLPVSEIWGPLNSGRVHGLGWVWDTNHLHLDVTLQWVGGGEEPPEPGEGDIAAAILELARQVGRIADKLG